MSEIDEAPLIAQLETRGWAVQPLWALPDLVRQLREEALAQHEAGLFKQAGVGSGTASVATALRGDQLRWLNDHDATAAQTEVFTAFEHLRLAVNRSLMLGLFELEAHFTVYPPGAFYKRHVDRFRDDDARSLSTILYLNESWEEADGGKLRIEIGEGESVDVLPAGGTLVAFLSDRFPHEVLPARRRRVSLTGWFKRRTV